ncbi:MAG: ATP-binding domain-containing protein, partial [Erysipelotrichaceae bacterium]|nr:ATP-binding domain-containing protein [Erysipelotrichaceae bacterium]
IMNFEKDFKPCHSIVLNQNYRSTMNILNGANSLIKNNRNRIDKDLFSEKSDNRKITHFTSAGDEYEAAWVANTIASGHKKGKSYKDYAILYRSNYLSRAIEKALLEQRVPYIIFGGVKFYERAEIKDILSYMRLINGQDDLAFMRVINMPKRGVGNKSIDAIREVALASNRKMYDVILQEKLFKGKTQETMDSFVRMIERFREDVHTMSVFELMEKVINETGYRKMLEEAKETERIENLKELINDVKSFTEEYPDSTLDEYLQLVTLYGDKDSGKVEVTCEACGRKQEISVNIQDTVRKNMILHCDNCGKETNHSVKELGVVRLMTVHASKGLEFDTVFVIGLNEGTFPSERAMQDGPKGVEEERRLAYVAYTRAKNKLYLSDSKGFSYVLQRSKVTSRFVNEVDSQYIEHIGADVERPKEPNFNNTFASSSESVEVTKPMSGGSGAKRLKKGQHVIHALFGEGVVVSVERGTATIAFPYPHGVKKILEGHPSLRRKEDLN